jgi:hypothetical protein
MNTMVHASVPRILSGIISLGCWDRISLFWKK